MKIGDLLSVKKDTLHDLNKRILPKGDTLTIKSIAPNTVMCFSPILDKEILLWKEEASNIELFRLIEK